MPDLDARLTLDAKDKKEIIRLLETGKRRYDSFHLYDQAQYVQYLINKIKDL